MNCKTSYNRITKWIVKLPYCGNSQTFIIEKNGIEYTAYSELTVGEYLKKDPNFKVVSDQELDRLNDEYEKTLIGDPIKTNEEYFLDKLNCLPPCNWQRFGNIEYFYMSEFLRGSLTEWNIRIGNDYYCFTNHYSLSHSNILKIVEQIKGSK